jgi:hypothetical protein
LDFFTNHQATILCTRGSMGMDAHFLPRPPKANATPSCFRQEVTMAARHFGSSSISFSPVVLKTRTSSSILVILLLAAAGMAQQPAQTTTEPDPQPSAQSPSNTPDENRAPDEAPVTIPAGTRFALVLTHPVDSKFTHRGDEIFAQTTAPVTVADQVALPAGTFVQGKVDKLTRRGSRGELLMQFVSVVFPNGYVVNVSGPINLETDEGTAWNNPGTGARVGVIAAPLAGLGAGALIGSAAHTTHTTNFAGMTTTSSTPKGLAIGSVVGLAAGGVVAFVLLARSHNFYVEVGSPLEMTLPQPLTLAQGQVTDSLREAAVHPAPLPVVAKRPAPPAPPMPASTISGMCYTAGTPGTPDTYIPGPPPIGNSPGTPGTVIPGIPATPIPQPCP